MNPAALGWADKAISVDLKGFAADWRDAPIPVLDAVTLMALRKPRDERIGFIVPVVRYVVERKIYCGGGKITGIM